MTSVNQLKTVLDSDDGKWIFESIFAALNNKIAS